MSSIDLQDRADINDTLARYTLAVDSGDWDALDTVFTPGAHIDYTASGGTSGPFPEVKAWLAENLPAFSKRTMHTLGQVLVVPAPDDLGGATVTAYFHNPMVISDGQGGERVVEVGGIYHHDFVFTLGGWRSRCLREEVIWTRGF